MTVSDLIRPSIAAYLEGEPLAARDIAVIRAWLRRWLDETRQGQTTARKHLRDDLDTVFSRSHLDTWFDRASIVGLDPLPYLTDPQGSPSQLSPWPLSRR